MVEPLKDLSGSRKDCDNSKQAYSIEDVNKVSSRPGIPWEQSKDVPFGPRIPFIGFDWDLETKMVALQKKKQEKYTQAIVEWRRKSHTLGNVEQLYGKLLHTCTIIPEGRANITGLESMLGIFHHSPHKPHRPPCQVE